MACILRLPTNESVGVLSITTQERSQIYLEPALRTEILDLKPHWMIGLHHNWHDYNFKYDNLFDFSFAGEGDLRERNGVNFTQIKFDACNFVPKAFHLSQTEKFWDVLYVARAVYFKRIPEFFSIIRKLFDKGHRLRVLFICPIPPYSRSQKKTVFYDIRKEYDRIFNEEEKRLFTLMTLNYRYPFPFDLDTLAFFYKSAKVFVHTADDERRCRVAAYAWAMGMPVVCMEDVASLIPKNLRKPPVVYIPTAYDEFEEKILKSLKEIGSQISNSLVVKSKQEFDEGYLLQRLDYALKNIAIKKGFQYVEGQLLGENLGIRLGRHHDGFDGTNSFSSNLRTLVSWLKRGNLSALNDLKHSDFESVINEDVMNYFIPTPKIIIFKSYLLSNIAKIKGPAYELKKVIFG